MSRDMRISSPSVAAAFIEGARAQGADVVDYGMMGTDMMYYAVARDGLDGGAQITASHNPKEYNGIKMVRREAFPLSGDAGIGDIRDMIAGGRLPPRRSSRRSLAEERARRLREARAGIHRSSIIKPFNVVLDAATASAAWSRRCSSRTCPAAPPALCMEVDGVPQSRGESAHRGEPSRHRRTGEAGTGGYRIAWDGDADRVFFIDGTGEFVAGDFITALLAEAFLIKNPGSKIVYDVRASYAVKDIVAKYGGTALMNRVGHAFFKRRMREENAIFGGEVTGHYYGISTTPTTASSRRC